MTTSLESALDAFEILMEDDSTARLLTLWEGLDGPPMKNHALSVLDMLSKEQYDPAVMGYALGRIVSV